MLSHQKNSQFRLSVSKRFRKYLAEKRKIIPLKLQSAIIEPSMKYRFFVNIALSVKTRDRLFDANNYVLHYEIII